MQIAVPMLPRISPRKSLGQYLQWFIRMVVQVAEDRTDLRTYYFRMFFVCSSVGCLTLAEASLLWAMDVRSSSGGSVLTGPGGWLRLPLWSGVLAMGQKGKNPGDRR